LTPAAASHPRIKSLSGASSPGFTGVRGAVQTPRAYSGELGANRSELQPKLQPWKFVIILVQARSLITQEWQRAGERSGARVLGAGRALSSDDSAACRTRAHSNGAVPIPDRSNATGPSRICVATTANGSPYSPCRWPGDEGLPELSAPIVSRPRGDLDPVAARRGRTDPTSTSMLAATSGSGHLLGRWCCTGTHPPLTYHRAIAAGKTAP